jgi:hypothetical protein
MPYDPWELESKAQDRVQQLRREADRMRLLGIWRRGRVAPEHRHGRGPLRRAATAVLGLFRHSENAARPEVPHEGRTDRRSSVPDSALTWEGHTSEPGSS